MVTCFFCHVDVRLSLFGGWHFPYALVMLDNGVVDSRQLFAVRVGHRVGVVTELDMSSQSAMVLFPVAALIGAQSDVYSYWLGSGCCGVCLFLFDLGCSLICVPVSM